MEQPFNESNLAYYQTQGDAFFEKTVFVDMEAIYKPFLSELPEGASILDAGCGSGRDTKTFLEKGYRVTALDASPKMVELASQYTGQSVSLLDLREIENPEMFEGIWACASLLHIPYAELPQVFERLNNALKPGGTIYVSFKYGEQERLHEGRWFTDVTEARLQKLIKSVPELKLKSVWLTIDQRPFVSQLWLNALLQKQKSAV